jgi:hypothetical protein
MFSNVTIGIFFGLGVAAWVYSKVQRRTGGNTQSSLIVSGLVGLLAFLFIVTVLGLLF